MGLVVIALISIFLCFKWGDWKNWRKYYPTILFYIITDINHMLLTSKKELWLIHGFINDTLSDYFISLVIAPCIIILFLSNYPKHIAKQVIYMLLYVVIFAANEFIANKYNGIAYYNGWNFLWTIGVYAFIFILLILHHKQPHLAWLAYLMLTGIVLFSFKISLLNLR